MAKWYPIQNSFHGGEVSARITMRQDIQQYKQSVFRMVNWMTNPQGTVERVPGTRFLQTIRSGANPRGRIIAFRDANEIDALFILQTDGVEVLTNLDIGGAEVRVLAGQPTQNIVLNPSFRSGDEHWDYNPLIGPTIQDQIRRGGVLFNTLEDNSLASIVAIYTVQDTTATVNFLRQTLIVGAATDSITYNLNANLTTVASHNAADLPDETMVFKLKIYESDGTTLLGEALIAEPIRQSETTINVNRTGRINIGAAFVGDIVLAIESLTPIGETPGVPDGRALTARLDVDSISILATSTRPPVDSEVPEDPDTLADYTADELPFVQFIQSPYAPAGSLVWKELVLVHPNHAPRRLYWDFTAGGGSGAYVYDELPFFKQDPDPANLDPPVPFEPAEWGAGAFPASCSAYQGRLVLGGGGTNGEDIMLSVTGEWGNLFDVEINYNPAAAFPTSALKLTTTFRSATRWVSGQKDLFIGASELEYRVSSDGGILRPGDIDARVHTSHGSAAVQPIPMGDEIVFPAENGKKLRGLVYRRESLGYVAKDLTLLHPFILSVGIVRMVRVRNPHQIVVCVLKDGTVAMLHYEPSVGLVGWSRMTTQGSYIDVTVSRDENGNDVPIFLVQRKQFAGDDKDLFLEHVPQWEVSVEWVYMDSYIVVDNIGATNEIAGFDHLEGAVLNVVGDGAYLGDFTVDAGVITLVDGYGEPIIPILVIAGLAKESNLVLLPPVIDEGGTGGMGAFKRYTKIGLRLRNSQPPIINGVRPPERAGDMTMDVAAPLITLDNVTVANTGYDEFQFVEISEVLPVRCEIVGVFGQLESTNL